MAKALTRSEISALAQDLKAMLVAIESGELAASAALRHRIEGAITALDTALGNRPSTDIELGLTGGDR